MPPRKPSRTRRTGEPVPKKKRLVPKPTEPLLIPEPNGKVADLEEMILMVDADEEAISSASARTVTFGGEPSLPHAQEKPQRADVVAGVDRGDVVTPAFESRGLGVEYSDSAPEDSIRLQDDKISVFAPDDDTEDFLPIHAPLREPAAPAERGEAISEKGDAVMSDQDFEAELAAIEDAVDNDTLNRSVEKATAQAAAQEEVPTDVGTESRSELTTVKTPAQEPAATPATPPPQDWMRELLDAAKEQEDILREAEARAKKALDVVAANTDKRAGSRFKRFLAFGAVIGAAVIAAFAALNHDAPQPAPEKDQTVDVSGGVETAPDVGVQKPVVETPPATHQAESNAMPIGVGEGSSQVFAHMGMDNAHIQQALDLPVQIGSVTVPVRDTYVTAKPGELTLNVDLSGDQATGVHYSLGDRVLSPDELSDFLIVSHPAEKTVAKVTVPAPATPETPQLASALDGAPDSTPDTLDAAPVTHPAPDNLPVLAAEDPTEMMPGRPAAVAAEAETVSIAAEAVTERVEPKENDYPKQIAALDALLQTEKDHTLELASHTLEFRKRGDRYEVRYIGSKMFDELTPALMANLEQVAHLDLEHPLSVMAITPAEYAYALPDGDPYKERVRQALRMQLEMASQTGYVDLEARKNLRILQDGPEPIPAVPPTPEAGE